jgi:hypothetical protein
MEFPYLINMIMPIMRGEEQQLMKLLDVRISIFFCFSLLSGSKYSPQHSGLRHPQSAEDSAVYMPSICLILPAAIGPGVYSASNTALSNAAPAIYFSGALRKHFI